MARKKNSIINTTSRRGHYKNRNADEKQVDVYKHFPADTFLGNDVNVDHFMQWMTLFRRNFQLFAKDYLGLTLFPYQKIMLYLMGINNFIVVVASRAAAKSYIIALYACCRCILYPGSMVVLASATKGQSKLLVTEKIEKELMRDSVQLRKEISNIKVGTNDTVVYFKNGSTITVVPASENGRGYRSTCLVREEFRQIAKFIDDSILSPFQFSRQPPYSKDPYYSSIDDLMEEAIDIYISSSWYDNGHWMWNIVDQAYEGMMEGKNSCLLAFDESVVLKHKLKTQQYYQSEKKKQDPTTWELEFMNTRLKENIGAYFSYSLMEQNRTKRMPFYPRTLVDYVSGRKNPYDIPKQPNEVRIISCDMAFVENKINDNSVFSCMRFLPESITHKNSDDDEVVVDNGYRRIVSYLEPIQGGETRKQAIRIYQLFKDFDADYICLDTRNGGVTVYDFLARPLFDEERNVEYPALTCMNDEGYANRIRVDGAEPRIFAINASAKLNSDIAIDFRRILAEKKIEFLCTYDQALEEILPKIKEYNLAVDADTQIFYESPFFETQNLFSETTNLLYEKDSTTGRIKVYEQSGNRKDRYTSVSYGSYFATLLERGLRNNSEDYEYEVLIN
ncbi:MAG: hypothetical protein LUC91_00790 [Prevotella sp.]|nr:hypothetical protein [Prevotella sp.]